VQDYIQGLQMLGGILALPRSAQYAQEDVLQKRAMLRDTGLTEAEINKMLPDAPMGWLRPGEGVGGKILGGVGDVGALLSTIAGQPIGPPRASISELAAASKMRKEFKQQNAYEALAASVEKDDPTGAALIRAGNVDAYGRRSAAQLAHPPGEFGKSEEGLYTKLAWLKKNKPDSPEIPALEQGIKDYEARHPVPPPPEKKIPPAEAWQQRHDVMIQARQKEAGNYGYKPGTPEYNYYMQHGFGPPAGRGADKDLDYNYFFKQALAAEKQRAAGMGDVPNMDNVKTTADAAWQAYQEKHGSKGGTTPPQTPTPPTGPPQPPAPRPEAKAPAPSYNEPPPREPGTPTTSAPPAATSETPTSSPTAQAVQGLATAFRTEFGAGGTQLQPAELAGRYPEFWRAAGLEGLEGISSAQLADLLSDPTRIPAFREQLRAPQQQGAPEQGLPQMTSEKTGNPMSDAGVREFLALQAEIKAGATKDRQAQIAIRLHQLE